MGAATGLGRHAYQLAGSVAAAGGVAMRAITGMPSSRSAAMAIGSGDRGSVMGATGDAADRTRRDASFRGAVTLFVEALAIGGAGLAAGAACARRSSSRR